MKKHSGKYNKHGFEKRAGWLDPHHIRIPGGETIPSNLIWLDRYRHEAWHLLFKLQRLDEIISLLERMKSTKNFLESFQNYYKHRAFRLLFGDKTFEQILSLLKRVRDIKKTQHKKYSYGFAA